MSEATTTDAKPWRWLLYAMVGIPVLALVSCGVMLLTASGDKTVDASDAQARAVRPCRDAVRAKLKSPSSAKFSDEATSIDRETDAAYSVIVSGTVEAQNSFGAMVANTFSCKVGVLKKGDTDPLATVTELSER